MLRSHLPCAVLDSFTWFLFSLIVPSDRLTRHVLCSCVRLRTEGICVFLCVSSFAAGPSRSECVHDKQCSDRRLSFLQLQPVSRVDVRLCRSSVTVTPLHSVKGSWSGLHCVLRCVPVCESPSAQLPLSPLSPFCPHFCLTPLSAHTFCIPVWITSVSGLTVSTLFYNLAVMSTKQQINKHPLPHHC